MNSDQDTSKAKKGWAGGEMEMSHHREQLRSTDHVSKTQYGTVDLGQLQNKEVGHGYQARGVVRQRNGQERSGMKIVDMTKNTHEKEDDINSGISTSSSKEKRRKRTSKRKTKVPTKKDKDEDPVQKYLQCKALCDFRRELEKILSESKR